METFCTMMDMPPHLTRNNYDKQANGYKVVKAVAKNTMLDAASDIHLLKPKDENGNDFVDCAVSCDDSWQRRGFSSFNCFITEISMDTGKIVDIVKVVCQMKSIKHWIQYDEIWQADHQCKTNHRGSAPAMESEGAKTIFSRSITTNNPRYTQFYGDGDSKSFSSVENIYSDIKVVQLECVGHVQKRMGTRLRKLKKKVKNIGGKAKHTDAMIDRLQCYYGIAIRRNK